MRAAVLLTCFNRREKTLSCLKSIYAQSKVKGLESEIFLVDDGSSDGTSDAIGSAFPKVKIISGDGSLYWNGGMNMAWRAALKEGFDCYIWINDDVSISTNAFRVMFDSFRDGYEECGTDPVIVGCFHETDSNSHSYGGFSVKKTLWKITKKRVFPEGKIKRCDTFNGNLVLISDSIVGKVGLLDGRFTHALGDIEYGYRCGESSIPMYITPEYVGECARNSIEDSWFDPNVTLKERYKRLMLPTGHPPKEYFYSYRKNCNSFAGGVALLKLYLRLLFPKFWLRYSGSESGE